MKRIVTKGPAKKSPDKYQSGHCEDYQRNIHQNRNDLLNRIRLDMESAGARHVGIHIPTVRQGLFRA